jgi:hypothetical protein
MKDTPVAKRDKLWEGRREMGKVFTVMIIALAVSICGETSGAMWYVAPPPLGNNKNPGTEELPFATIQNGIDTATEGDTVIVAKGTYFENINFNGKNIILRSTDPTDWNVVARTIIDGNQAGSVVRFAGTEDESCVLSGFALQNGSGTEFEGPSGYGTSTGGGGISGGDWSANRTRATIENNIIAGNSPNDGGGIFACDGLIQDNLIVGNAAGRVGPQWHGGGLFACFGVIQNNVIAGNVAGCGGGAAHCNAVFRNNTIVGNDALAHGSGLSHCGTSWAGPAGGSITNCIVWGNICPSAPQVGDSVSPTHCCIQDWTGGGEGNIALNPRFVDPDGADNDPSTFEDNDYRLLPASICIDAGTNEDWMNAATDLDGNPRILIGASSLTVDVGAYEYRFDLAIVRKTESDIELSWAMRPQRSYTILSSFNMTAEPWTEETTMLGGKSGGPASWIDADGTCTAKFYRIELK